MVLEFMCPSRKCLDILVGPSVDSTETLITLLWSNLISDILIFSDSQSHEDSLSLSFSPHPPLPLVLSYVTSGWPPVAVVTMSTISPTDFDSLEIQQQYNDINNRWDLASETDWDNENSSARLFERSRIKALAGRTRVCVCVCVCFVCVCFVLGVYVCRMGVVLICLAQSCACVCVCVRVLVSARLHVNMSVWVRMGVAALPCCSMW